LNEGGEGLEEPNSAHFEVTIDQQKRDTDWRSEIYSNWGCKSGDKLRQKGLVRKMGEVRGITCLESEGCLRTGGNSVYC